MAKKTTQQPVEHWVVWLLQKFSFRDVVLALGGIVTLMAHYYGIKSELQSLRDEQKLINFRLNILDGHPNVPPEKTISFNEAIVPEQLQSIKKRFTYVN